MTRAAEILETHAPPIARQFVTFETSGQLLGLSVLTVQDVLGPQRIMRIPLAPDAVAGAINLRGRIVTVLDLRICLGQPPHPTPEAAKSIVIDHGGELYSLLIDAIGDVVTPPEDRREDTPANLPTHWRDACECVYRLDERILLAIDIDKIVRSIGAATTERGR